MLGLYRNEVAVPRAYLVPESRAVPNADDALALVRLPDFDPRRTVVVEAQGPAMPDAPLGAADVVIVHEEPDRVAMETACVRAAWLVLNDPSRRDGRPRSTANPPRCREPTASCGRWRWARAATVSSSFTRRRRCDGVPGYPVRP
jgi:hypothetical protein